MEATPEDFQKHFELLSDDALLDTKRDELVDVARECFDEEVSRRGLHVASRTNARKPREDYRYVQIAKFHFRSEFEVAKALLKSENIPATQGSRIGRRIELELPLMVPIAFAEQALELIRSKVPHEELDAVASASPFRDYIEDTEEDGPAAPGELDPIA